MENKINTISLHKIKERIGSKKDSISIVSNDNSFYIVQENNEEYYVDPLLSYIDLGINSEYNQTNIILISAPGATGKTEMTKYLSYQLNVPVFDLGKHDAVGSHSFIGMLYNSVSTDCMANILKGLNNGTYTIIIDALDEGFTKSQSTSAFEAFLKEIADIGRKSSGLAFIIFGRTSILEYSALFFEEKAAKVSLLQIEPFKIDKARTFIDKYIQQKVKDCEFNPTDITFRQVKDIILERLKSFFNNESVIKTLLYERFIGYAPVLQSIAQLFYKKDDKGRAITVNYQVLLNQFQAEKEHSIKLLNKIIESILIREREKLLGKNDEYGLVGKDLISLRGINYFKDFRTKAYDIDEQCIRLLNVCLGDVFKSNITSDDEFNKEYDKSVSDWLKEHPFKTNNRIINAVFEAYILVRLINRGEYTEHILKYLKNKGNGSYMLYNIFKNNIEEYSFIDSRFVPYLIDSFQSLDKGTNRSKVDIFSVQDDNEVDDNIVLEIEFSRENNTSREDNNIDEYSIRTIIPKKGTFALPRIVSSMLIDAENLNVDMSNITTELSAPVTIVAKEIWMYSKDFQFRAFDKNNNSIELDCQNFYAESLHGGMQNISKIGCVDIKISSENTILFPFVNYRQDKLQNSKKEGDLYEKYQKLRRIILHFHSYKGGELAKFKTKIDNRIGNKTIGKKVLNALINVGIIIEDGSWYFINKNKLDEFGIDFNKIRSTKIEGKLKEFLMNI